jgi:hypothetical protein
LIAWPLGFIYLWWKNVFRSFYTSGDVYSLSDGSIQNGIAVKNDIIKPFNISLQIGGAYNLTRHLSLAMGLEFKPSVFINDPSVNNNQNIVYPTFGLRYSLFQL